MILEGIVTTLNEDDSVNISPMGPNVDETMSRFVLRPYQTSTTYKNLKRTGDGVLHVTDDVELLAQAAVNRLAATPQLANACEVRGQVLVDTCRWYEFRVVTLDDTNDRTAIECETVFRKRNRDFFGFNRAKHAVVEAAIMATRTQFLPADQILDEFQRLAVIIEKTAGESERRAFAFLQHFVDEQLTGS